MDFKSVREISQNVTRPVIAALTRAKQEDIDVAVDALKYAKRGRIHTGIGSSDIHIKHKFNSSREKILEKASEAVKYARNHIDDVEFFAEDAGRADNDFLCKLVETVIAAGATVVNVPDTTGYCLPWQYGEKIKYLFDNVPNVDKATISVHCHNDLGLATANSIQGIMNGARQVECTINGIGERAGNTALEEVVMVMRSHKEFGYDTDVNTEHIYPTSQLVSQRMKMPVQPNKAIVGSNAFAHSSGIHQDGFLKHRENYEIIDPADVGVEKSRIVLTARSGRAALSHRLEELDYKLSREEMDRVYEKFLELADQKKEIVYDDLMFLMREFANEESIKEKK